MDNKNSREYSKIESLSSPSSPKREDLKLDKKLKEPLSKKENYQESTEIITPPTETKNTENLKGDLEPKKPTKIKIDAYLNKPKKPTDQEGEGVSISQVQTQDVGVQNQNLETESRDVETQTENYETETQNVETQVEPSPRQPTGMPRQNPLQLPPPLKKVKREETKNPSFSPEVDKPPSESKTAPLPEEAIDSEITYRPKANEESAIIEESSVEPQAAVESYGQQIGVPVGPHAQVRERSKTDLGVGFKVAFLVLLSAAVCLTFINVQSRDSSIDSSIDFTPEPDTDAKKEKELSPSVFISIYLSREKAQLGKWLVVTRNLFDIDKRVTKSMIGQVVAIIDHDRDGVIIEIFIEEFEPLNPLEQYISPFKELSILSTLKMEVKLFFESLQSNRFFSLLKVINAF